jgi:spore maturation protein CgeB
MRVLILNTDYFEFLCWLYTQHPQLERQAYEEQMRVRNESLFGVADFYSSNLRKLGYEAWDIHANNKFLQKAWADEHGLRLDSGRRWEFRLRRGIVPWVSRVQCPWFFNILKAQIKHYNPDILLNQAMDTISSSFLKEMKPHVRLLMGQHAAPLPEREDFSCYDFVVSSLPNLVGHFRRMGIPAELHRLAFEPRVLRKLRDGEPKTPIIFVGSMTAHHQDRVQLLESLCRRPETKIYGQGIDCLPKDSLIRQRYQGEAWGVDMYQLLFNSKITINHHIGMAKSYANNMRLFEATGVGTLLVTDWKKNLHEMFEPGKEVVCYRTREECAETLQYYLEHDKEREEIARAGQQRTLRDHTYYQRMQELMDIVERQLRQRPGPKGFRIASGTRPFERVNSP